MVNFEIDILKYLQSNRTDTLNNLFELITMLGEETVVILIIAILYFALDKKFAQKFLFIMLASLSTNGTIKNIVKRPRPFTIEGITCVRKETATGYSFPSGHTQTFSTWSMTLLEKHKKVTSIIITLLLITLVAFSRVYLGAHYPSDVIIGAILGISFAILGNKLYDTIGESKKAFKMLFLILTPFVIFFLIRSDILYEDFFKVYGMTIGMYLSIIVEEKYAQLKYDVSWKKKVTRIVGALIIALIIKELTNLIILPYVQISLLLEIVKHLILVLSVFGVWPIVIKKLKL